MELGKRLVALRQTQGKPVEDVANYLCVLPSSYKRYESGERLPDISVLLKLAIYYDCSLDYLVGRDDVLGITVDRSELVSYQDLVNMGLNGKLAHALIKTVWDKLPYDQRINLQDDQKTKHVLKVDMITLLEDLKDKVESS